MTTPGADPELRKTYVWTCEMKIKISLAANKRRFIFVGGLWTLGQPEPFLVITHHFQETMASRQGMAFIPLNIRPGKKKRNQNLNIVGNCICARFQAL